jgi:hypothetical protein
VAGDEATEAMLAHFPATENDEPITKEFLRAELAEFCSEVRGELAGIHRDLNSFYHRLSA